MNGAEVQRDQKPIALKLPNIGEPSECTVSAYGGNALIVFQGDGYPVARSCNEWINSSAKKHGLRTQTSLAALDDQSCFLRSKKGWEYVTVIDRSPDVDGAGKASCQRLRDSDQWTNATVKDLARYFPAKPKASPPPVAGSPVLRIGNWAGREPTMLEFDADGGDILSNLRWTWDKTQALGRGESSINTCIPDCAGGARMPVRAYILLSHPVDGQFTRLTESQGGYISHQAFPPPRHP